VVHETWVAVPVAALSNAAAATQLSITSPPNSQFHRKDCEMEQ
jgi:hypothetical protein